MKLSVLMSALSSVKKAILLDPDIEKNKIAMEASEKLDDAINSIDTLIGRLKRLKKIARLLADIGLVIYTIISTVG